MENKTFIQDLVELRARTDFSYKAIDTMWRLSILNNELENTNYYFEDEDKMKSVLYSGSSDLDTDLDYIIECLAPYLAKSIKSTERLLDQLKKEHNVAINYLKEKEKWNEYLRTL